MPQAFPDFEELPNRESTGVAPKFGRGEKTNEIIEEVVKKLNTQSIKLKDSLGADVTKKYITLDDSEEGDLEGGGGTEYDVDIIENGVIVTKTFLISE